MKNPRRAIVKNSIASKYIRVVSFGSRTCFVHETNLVVILMFCVMFLFSFCNSIPFRVGSCCYCSQEINNSILLQQRVFSDRKYIIIETCTKID